MYNNTGSKIKGLASTLQVIGIIFSCLIGLVIMIAGAGDGGFFLGLLYAAIGWFASWLSFLLLAGFGELIENSAKIVMLLSGGALPEDIELVHSKEPKVDTTEFSGVEVTRAEVDFVMETQGLPYGEAYVVAKKAEKGFTEPRQRSSARLPQLRHPGPGGFPVLPELRHPAVNYIENRAFCPVFCYFQKKARSAKCCRNGENTLQILLLRGQIAKSAILTKNTRFLCDFF